MNKKLLWFLLPFFIVLLIIFVTTLKHKELSKLPFNNFTFPSTLNVNNNTEYKKADTIVLVLANKIFNFDTLDILLYDIPNIMNKTSNMDLYAIVQKLPFKNHSYLIFLKPNMDLEKLKLSISHEFIHIKQYENGELILYDRYAIWHDRIIFFKELEYEKRPFEIEAFSKQYKIRKELNKILYK